MNNSRWGLRGVALLLDWVCWPVWLGGGWESCLHLSTRFCPGGREKKTNDWADLRFILSSCCLCPAAFFFFFSWYANEVHLCEDPKTSTPSAWNYYKEHQHFRCLYSHRNMEKGVAVGNEITGSNSPYEDNAKMRANQNHIWDYVVCCINYTRKRIDESSAPTWKKTKQKSRTTDEQLFQREQNYCHSLFCFFSVNDAACAVTWARRAHHAHTIAGGWAFLPSHF